MGKIYNLVELFSGIGSQAKALENLDCKINTVGTCEWDLHAFVAYDAIHNDATILDDVDRMSKEEILDVLKDKAISNNGKEAMQYKTLKTYSETALKRILSAIIRSKNYIDVSALNGNDICEKVDILTYSFPCQDLSNVGAFHGYNKGIDKDSGSRSSLLWQVGRILKEMKDAKHPMPRYLLMENVPALLSKRHKGNFETWIQDLEDLGYKSKPFLLNARFFGLPQNRPRLLMVSVYIGNDDKKAELFESFFAKKDPETVIQEYQKSKHYQDLKLKDLLRIDYTNPEIKREADDCNPNKTVSRDTIWENNPKLLLEGNVLGDYDFVRTITTKQDRNPNSGNLYYDNGIEGRSKFRYLTPRECLLFMGFTDDDYENLVKKNPEIHKNSVLFPRDKIIRMAGNSIPVKLLEGIFYQIIKFDEQLGNN